MGSDGVKCAKMRSFGTSATTTWDRNGSGVRASEARRDEPPSRALCSFAIGALALAAASIRPPISRQSRCSGRCKTSARLPLTSAIEPRQTIAHWRRLSSSASSPGRKPNCSRPLQPLAADSNQLQTQLARPTLAGRPMGALGEQGATMNSLARASSLF